MLALIDDTWQLVSKGVRWIIMGDNDKVKAALKSTISTENRKTVMLQPGILLNARCSEVATILSLLFLPPVTQICGKRVLRVV